MATLVSTANFLPLIMPYVHGVPQMAIQAEVVRSAVRFCEMTGIWREYGAPIDVVASQAEYSITLPTGHSTDPMQPIQIEELYYKNSPLWPTTVQRLKETNWDWNINTGTPREFTQLQPTKFILSPIPQTADAGTGLLTLLVSYKPTMTATTIPDFLFNQFGFGIAAGAMGELFAMPGRTWFNPALAQFYARKFGDEVILAKSKASKGWTKANKFVMTRFV